MPSRTYLGHDFAMPRPEARFHSSAPVILRRVRGTRSARKPSTSSAAGTQSKLPGSSLALAEAPGCCKHEAACRHGRPFARAERSGHDFDVAGRAARCP